MIPALNSPIHALFREFARNSRVGRVLILSGLPSTGRQSPFSKKQQVSTFFLSKLLIISRPRSIVLYSISVGCRTIIELDVYDIDS